jgi:HAD superfamily hydrolase (TIGR01509 family)
MPALVFDCDGVLSDTERHGHLPAFNQTFREFGLPVEWGVEEYGQKLLIAGGEERMASLLTPHFIAEASLPHDAVLLQDLFATWHKRKTEIYVSRVRSGLLPGRPGVARVATEALDHGWCLAVASTSAPAAVQAVLEHVVGARLAARFDAVLGGDVVAHKKPAPDIYQLAVERLDVDPREVLVIEDSRNGLLAATAAGLRTLVTTSNYTATEDFGEASLVVTSLGEPNGVRTEVLANRSKANPRGWIVLSDLAACLGGWCLSRAPKWLDSRPGRRSVRITTMCYWWQRVWP